MLNIEKLKVFPLSLRNFQFFNIERDATQGFFLTIESKVRFAGGVGGGSIGKLGDGH